MNGSACRLVKMLSRPNIVWNQGRPAAGRWWPGSMTGEKRSAARSTRLRWYVRLSGSQSQSRRGASSIHFSRLRSMFGRARLAPRSYLGVLPLAPAAPRPGVTWKSVVHSPWGSRCTLNVRPCSSTSHAVVAEIHVSRTNVSRR